MNSGSHGFELRFVVSGLAVLGVSLVALALAKPSILRSDCIEGLSGLVVLVASGGVGFLLAQVYFALPSLSVPDYTSTIKHLATGPRNAKWAGGITSEMWEDATKGRSKASRILGCDRPSAQSIAHVIWKRTIAESQEPLDALTSSLASRKAAVGATLVGTVSLLVLWYPTFLVLVEAGILDEGAIRQILVPIAVFASASLPLVLVHSRQMRELTNVVNGALSQICRPTRWGGVGPTAAKASRPTDS